MAQQFFKVVNQQGEGTVDQGGQFYQNPAEEHQQVRYILTDESQQQYQQQQVVQVPQERIMVISTPQPVLVDQNQMHYQQSPSQNQHYGQNLNNTSPQQQPQGVPQQQQVYYMETMQVDSSNLPAVLDQVPPLQPMQQQGQAQPNMVQQPSNQTITQSAIVKNHQIGPNTQVRQMITPGQRPVLQIRRGGLTQGQVQINSSTNRMPSPQQPRPGMPQQVMRPAVQMRTSLGVGVQMRMRAASPQMRPNGPNQVQVAQQQQAPQRTIVVAQQNKPAQQIMMNRQMQAGMHQQQQQQQQPPQLVIQQSSQQPQDIQQQQQSVVKQIQRPMSAFQNVQNQESQQPQQQPMARSDGIVKEMLQYASQQRAVKNQQDVDELDDHDPSMTSNPAQIANFKMGKAGLGMNKSNQIRINQLPQKAAQQQIGQQINQQQQFISQDVGTQNNSGNLGYGKMGVVMTHQGAQILNPGARKTKNPPRPRNPNPTPRQGLNPRMPRVPTPPRMNSPQQQGYPRTMGQQAAPRFQGAPRGQNPQQVGQMGGFGPPNNQQAANQMQQRMQAPQQQPMPQQPPTQQPPPQQPPRQQQENQMNYLIMPPTPNRPRTQRPLPSYIASSQIQQIIDSTPVGEEFSDSIRMLVLLENGEQRLITFTLPKEACTIQEILEQVNVPFTQETSIQVTEANTNGINYIVTVGNVGNLSYTNEEPPEPRPMTPSPPPSTIITPPSPTQPPLPQLPPPKPRTPSPELPKEMPKFILGKLALCPNCGYTGEDFNKCARCSRKLPDNVKSIDNPFHRPNGSQPKPELKKPITVPVSSTATSTAISTAEATIKAVVSAANKSANAPKKKGSKAKAVENHDSVVISSDEEDDEKKPNNSVSEQLLKSLGASVTISPVASKEPSLAEIKKHTRKPPNPDEKFLFMRLKCRTIRIGSYRFVPLDDVTFDSKSINIKAPVSGRKDEAASIRIDKGDIVKILICFNKNLPVIFYYLNTTAAPSVCELLNLKQDTGIYYDPVSEKNETLKKITLLFNELDEEKRKFFLQLYPPASGIMEEVTLKEANDILIKTSTKEASSSLPPSSLPEIKQILEYPPEGKGRLSINTEDYVCLAADQFLNDKIIDFYLRYLWDNLPSDLKEKVHIFSTFFYKRLTTKPPKATRKSHPHEADSSLTPAQKRHYRVKTWTRKVNLFEKDFIVVPINENAHWFLAIICFPSMQGMQTFDGKPYKVEPKVKKVKKSKKEPPIPCDDPLLSDKDEAESDDEDLESDDSDASTASAAAAAAAAAAIAAAAVAASTPKQKKEPRPPYKQPCILIFDSLRGPSRTRVVATLRDYLTCERKDKLGIEKPFDKDSIKGSCLKVPQQTNFTDCGLYLLQYVEHFFKEPLKDFHTPMNLKNWFEEIIVTRKREDIANLLKHLIRESGGDLSLLPDIVLPTVDGKPIERPSEEDEEEDQEHEDMFTDIEDSEMTENSCNTTKISDETGESEESSSPLKPSIENCTDKSGTIVTTVTSPSLLKPALGEFPRQSSKDTLSILKAKRIVRHNKPEGPDNKKTKMEK